MIRHVAFLPGLLALASCASVQDTARKTANAATEVGSAVIREEAPASIDRIGQADTLEDALLTPARDLGIRQEAMPEELARLEDPYASPPEGCDLVVIELAELDGVLGPDYGEHVMPRSGATTRKGMNLMAKAVGSVMPYRGVVREVTGAKAREQALRESYRRGAARRAYLKGVARERGCDL